jgi:nucleoside 2-deoxyribosyltransferase
MKIYIAGKITDNPDYMEQFAAADKALQQQGHATMNPTVLPAGFEHHEYMQVCLSMIDVCEAVYFLDNWRESKGAQMEYGYAIQKGKTIMYA